MSVPKKERRTSWPFAMLAVVCAAAVVGVLAGTTTPLSAAQFANTGHWVYNSFLGSVFHIDGATTNIDAQLAIEGEQGSQVLQSDTSGFVVGKDRITEFDKESLEPRRSTKPPADEVPLGIEVVGGPYAVYRDAGTVVRLGDPTATISVGGSVGTPVVTKDGTMWLHRIDNGQLCRVHKDATELGGCPVSAPKDHAGALTVVDDKPAFVDLFTSQLHTIDDNTFGEGVPLGISLSPDARLATQDTHGKLAILDPAQSSLILVDTTTRSDPVTVALPSGAYDGPISTGDIVAMVDRQKGTVLTFGADGSRKDEKPIKDKTGEPRLSQGEDDRIYVEDAGGTQVLVVGDDGSVRDVDVAGKPETPVETPAQPQPGDSGQPGRPVDNGPPNSGPPDAGRQQGPPETQNQPPPPLPPTRPGAPLAVNAQAGDGSATVTWGAAPDNRAPITSYLVTWQGGSTTVGPGVLQATAGGLTNGVAYVFTVTATNQIGSGPGASSAPVTPSAPVSPAAPPVNLVANFDVDDRPTRNVTLVWGQPALGGGTLEYYEVTATNRATQTVTANQVVFPDVEATEVIDFTVRAVTRGPAGQLIPGEIATARHVDEQRPDPVVTIAKGGPSDTTNCHAPDCAWVLSTMSGLDPDTTYNLRLSSNDSQNVVTESFTTDGTGAGSYDQLNYDVPGNTVWVTVLTMDGAEVVRSGELPW